MRNCVYFLLTLILLSCNKEDKVSTVLQITVVDTLGNAVPNAEVWLYRYRDFWSEHTKSIAGPLYTDSKGVISIPNLDNVIYYFWVHKDHAHNDFTVYNTEKALKTNNINTYTVKIRPLTTWETYLSGGSSKKWKLLKLKAPDGTPLLDYPVLTDMHSNGTWYDSNGRLGLWWFNENERKIYYDYAATGAVVESKMISLSNDYFQAEIDFFGIKMQIEMVPE